MAIHSLVDLPIRPINSADHSEVINILAESGLSSVGLDEGGRYWLAHLDRRIVSVIGLERSGDVGLLRSLCVVPDCRSAGLAWHMVEHLMAEAASSKIQSLCLFSKDTGEFFARLGWVEVAVEQAAKRLSSAPQVIHYNRVGWYENERAFERLLTYPPAASP